MKILYVLLAILIFGFLIFIHELGHYIFARIFKVKIHEFSIGMGKSVISVTSKKTGIKYSISAIPIGGYVSMAGEDDDSSEENAFFKKPVWQRMIITVFGAVMNLILGFSLVMAMVINLANRETPMLGTTVVADFLPMEKTGYTVSTEGYLMPGDEILRIGGRRVHVSDEIDYEILHSGGGAVEFTVLRDGEIKNIDVTVPTTVESGVTFGLRDFRVYAEKEANFGIIMKHTFYNSRSTVRMIWDSIFDLVRGRYGMEAVSGPVGVAGTITNAAASGNSLNLIYIAAVISINLGIFNLLPIPALDGGRLVFLLIEAVRGKPIPKKIENTVNGTFLMLLFGFMIVITFKDVFMLIFR